MRERILALLALLFLNACATPPPPTKTQEEQKSQAPNKDAVSIVLKQEEPERLEIEEKSKKTASDIERLTIDDVIRLEEPNTQNIYDNSRYDFPITMNSKIEGWMDYFTGRGRHHFERYLGRSSRYIPLMQKVLKQEGLPEDLVYLALIESGFNTRARSRARAVGPWQFIKGTGKRYGLRINAWVDERRDPIRSTQAAARYLKDLYLMFESWYLAASAYNAGETRVLRAIENTKTNNYWRICQGNALRRETRDYIPKLIAAAIIAKNPKRYGFEDVVYLEPFEFDSVTVQFPIQLKEIARLVDVPEEEISDLNPELLRSMVPPNVAPYVIRVPQGRGVLVSRALAANRSELVVTDLPSEYVVKPGDTLATISKKFGLRAKQISATNNLGPREKLPPGTSLIIPKGGASNKTAKVKRGLSAEKEPKYIIHEVKRGESLWSISEKYNVTVSDLFRWNSLKKSRIRPGRKLKVMIPQTTESDDAGVFLQNKKYRYSNSTECLPLGTTTALNVS